MKTRRMIASLALGLGLAAALLWLLDGAPSGLVQARPLERQDQVMPPRDANAQMNRMHSRALVPLAAQGSLQSLSNPITEGAITIDGTREGWESVVPYVGDPRADADGAVDWITITLAYDCDELYVRYQVDDGPPFGYTYTVFVDVDQDRNTGFVGDADQLAIGADVLFQGRFDGVAVKASVFEFIGASGADWNWHLSGDNAVDDRTAVGTERDIEWKTPIAYLDVFSTGMTSFDWVATQGGGYGDFYPDGGNGGAAGEFNTYSLFAFANPERGLLHLLETHTDNYTPLDLDTLRCYRQNEGVTLVQRMFYMEAFTTSEISQAYLDAVQADFDAVRQAGLKAVVRFAYTTKGPPGPYLDASKAWILTHTNQLSPVLRSNSDVVATMQAGFIGSWGEWWYSDHFTPDGDWEDRRQVITAVLETLPVTRMVQIRTPRYKQNIFSTTLPLSLPEAHSGTFFARTGHHNDCFLSSPTDYGTYFDPSTEYPYLAQDTRYVVMGGETCVPYFPGDPDPVRLKCATAISEMTAFHWSFLNLDWYAPNLQAWRDQGCYEEIEQRLGYRFRLQSESHDPWVKLGDDLYVSLEIENEGFAAPYNPRDVELILRHNDGLTYSVPLSYDPRFWLPGETYWISHSMRIPVTMPVGSYAVLLNLPDPEPNLRQRPEYAIRLANDGVWDERTGYNKLGYTFVATECVYLPVVLRGD